MVFDFIREHQMNIMLALCAICAMMAVLLLITRFLPRKRKWILILLELVATFLLAFDRAAYTYRGDVSKQAYVMVRLSNFMVFFLTSAIVFGFNLYLTNLLLTEGKMQKIPRRLMAAQFGSIAGMLLAVVSHFTGLYYYFDGQNVYHRGEGFLIAYLIPVIIPILQYTVIRQYRKMFSRFIYISLVLYIFVPIIVGIIQIFTYGISIVNMAMVMVSVSLYVFAYLDINDEVARAHEIEVATLEKEQQSMKRLFDQTATAFVTAVEKRDEYRIGHAVRVANYAKRVAQGAGKGEKECDEVYYAALLHDVGMIGIPDSIIEKDGNLNEEERLTVQKTPELSAQILSSIAEYPYLESSALGAYERYDGSGYPKGLKGDDIPEISRIIAVADAYDSMVTKKRFREPMSYPVVREEFVMQAGQQFDPQYAELMVHVMDEDKKEEEVLDSLFVETEITCGGYRDHVGTGIPVTEEEIRIHFDCEEKTESENDFSAPSIILFDSYDRHIHDNAKAIEAYRYLEYGEIWFDGNFVSTSVRNMEVGVRENGPDTALGEYEYSITAKRYEDHVSITMSHAAQTVDIIAALPFNSKASYIGLTGEHCVIRDIEVVKTGELARAGQIKQIASKVSYLDRLEGDIENVQVDRTRSAATAGIPVKDEILIEFHSMSLPSATLVWHCPYIVLFDSEDGKVNGKNYKEYDLIKLNGEVEGDGTHAENQFHMKKTSEFQGWDAWKESNKEGMEFRVSLKKKGNRVTLAAENAGIEIRNTTILRKDGRVYAALTGDQVAITDIRVR